MALTVPMSPQRRRAVQAARLFVLIALGALALAGALGAAVASVLPDDSVQFLWPALATLVILALFTVALNLQVGGGVFGELGFLYLAFATVYTVVPALGLMYQELNPGMLWFLESLGPIQAELGIHLWRHVLFMLGVSAGYLLVRGRNPIRRNVPSERSDRDGRTIAFLLTMVIASNALLALLSAPVETYIDNYIRYDHLSWFPRKMVSLFVRLKLGMYCLLIVFLFRNYRTYRLAIPALVTIMCVYEITYTLGARIESLMILLMAACCYGYFVRPISLARVAVACVALAAIFTAVEVLRLLEFDAAAAKDVVLDAGFKPAFEFASVYWTGLHLYAERAHGALPVVEWPMFFYDFISPVTFNDFTQWNPQYWYAREYFPQAIVPPATLGPIADSAIWGGEIDLLLRSLINGAFFAVVVRWFLRHRDKWWGVTIYVYFYATCVITLKYSVFYQLTPLVKTLLPAFLLVWAVRSLFPSPPGSKPVLPSAGKVVEA